MARAEALDADFSLYRQLETILRDRIADGELRPADRLPSEDALGERFGISRGTVRQALDALERDGLIERTRGRGTFVSARAATFAERTRLPFAAMAAQATLAQRLMRTGSAVPPPVVAEALALAPGQEAPFFIRLSSRARARLGVKRYLHPDLADALEALASAEAFETALTGYGDIGRGPAWVEAILAEPRFAMQLKVPVGSALLSLWWVDLVDGAAAACTQMLQPGAKAALALQSADAAR